ncbi:MAG: phosphotransferase [Egibacteraceae bacterium]
MTSTSATSMVPAAVLIQIRQTVGAIHRVTPVGRNGRTWIAETDARRVVVKRMSLDHDPHQCSVVFAELVALSSSPFPGFVAALEHGESWYGLFNYVEGRTPHPDDTDWDRVWCTVLNQLTLLRDRAGIVPTWDVGQLWLKRFAELPTDTLISSLLKDLTSFAPIGRFTVAHGDLGAQNLLVTASGLKFLDWEEIGGSFEGFDAGWLLALNRVRAGPQWPHERLLDELFDRGYAESNLRYFERIGLLRLLYRARTLPMGEHLRALITGIVMSAIKEY